MMSPTIKQKTEIGRDVPLGKVKVEKENVIPLILITLSYWRCESLQVVDHGFNSKWTEETWITPPHGNSLISKSIQSETIQVLLERGIDGLIALQLFVDALPNSNSNGRGLGKPDNKVYRRLPKHASSWAWMPSSSVSNRTDSIVAFWLTMYVLCIRFYANLLTRQW